MAKVIFLTLMVISSLSIAIHAAKNEESWFQIISNHGNEKTAKLHFYNQNLVGGENKTVYEVVRGSITSDSLFSFGSILVLDNLVTVEPDLKSEPIGRFQGVATSADLKATAADLNAYFYFMSAGVNGSTISISGRNPVVMNGVFELAIVGGTGMFRFARGYVIKNYTTIVENEYQLVECTIYVTYMDN